MPRLLILTTKLGYQTHAFAEAAAKIGVDVAYGTDRCHVLEDPWGDKALALHFESPKESAQQILEFARSTPLDGIVSLGDRPTPTAARAAETLGLPFHSVAAAEACHDKYCSRVVLREAGLDVPQFVRVPFNATPLATFPFPWVLKPLSLSGSRGVVRANTAQEANLAFERICALLRSPDVRALREESSEFIQIEQYVEGAELALEAIVEYGRPKLLAIFDKPDPLTGPYFEETIYVTPSRLPQQVQQQMEATLYRAIAALGLRHGPVHAEMRVELDASGTRPAKIWILELAARCIGGLCANSLRFDDPHVPRSPDREVGFDHPITAPPHRQISLEGLLVRLALNESVSSYARERLASGVMMVPIPCEGIYEDVTGVEDAMQIPHMESIEITAKPGQRLLPLPEGSSYLGFIFARAATAEDVEQALRAAHARLKFTISPALPVLTAR